MIIKLYQKSKSGVLDLHIIEDARYVKVINSAQFDVYVPHSHMAAQGEPIGYFNEEKDENGKPRIAIEYTHKDLPCVVFVEGWAYICNDEGKTIEKVNC